ncbi:hypothetical protein QL093DRAFT_2113836 [Fusarium oxysporum]|nr:hypothetical protein QL093DRAFT_2113836 [Fusarium oxysporum]
MPPNRADLVTPVSPSVYMQRLEEETKRGNSLVPFLSKASRVDTTPRQSPKSWLEKLATTDFVSVRAVCHLDLDLVVNNIGYFDLLINDEATYNASALHGTGDSLPTLVFTVGQMVERRKDKTSTSSLEPTEYVLVIDAVAPGHPVWLIYNRNSIDDVDFPTVNDWIQSYGNVDRTKFEESIKATYITGAIEVKELPLAEAEELFRQ